MEKYYTVYAVGPVDEYPFRDQVASLDFLGISDGPIIGNIGRLTKAKGQVFLLRAFPTILDSCPSAHLLLMGTGPLENTLKEETQKLGISDHVTFTGKRPDVLDVLRGLDVFVMSSLWEGCGTAALEAMAVGVPIVATAVGGLSETIIPEVTGRLVRPADPASLAEAILQTLNNPESSLERASAARARVEQFFSAQAAAKRTASLYREVMES